jgi:O-antigen/teichoic acid export membrane protein
MIRSLIKNSFSSVTVPVVKTVITFIMAPVIVHSLGNYDYGIWEIAFSLIGMMEFLDFGLMPAIVRNVARYFALNDERELQRIYSTSLTFLFPIGLLSACIFLLVSLFAPDLMIKGAHIGGNKYSVFFVIVSFMVFFSFVGSVFDCYFEGLQLYTFRNNITIFFSLAGSSIAYYLLKNGGGILSLAIVQAGGLSLKYIIYGLLLFRKAYGGYRFRPGYVSRKTFKSLMTFGFKSLIWSLTLRVATLTDPLIIGGVLGAAIIPFYMIPYNFMCQVRNLIWSVTRVFLPAFSVLDALEQKGKSKDLYFSASRFMIGIIIPLVGGVCILGPSFLHHWMGHEYAEKGSTVLYIVAATYFIQWLNPFSRRFMTAIDRHEILARVGVISIIINLPLSFLLVHLIGKEGAAVGTLIPAILAEPYLLHKICKEMESNVAQYSFHVFLPLILPTLIFLVFLKGMMMVIPINSLVDVALLGILGLTVYTPVFAAFAMKREERYKIYCQIRQRVFSGA